MKCHASCGALSPWEWLSRVTYKPSEKEKTTQAMIEALHRYPDNPQTLTTAKKWIDQTLPKGKSHRHLTEPLAHLERQLQAKPNPQYAHPENQKLLREWVAKNWPTEALAQHPDLIQFLKTQFFDKCITFYNHHLKVNEKGIPCLPIDGVPKPWTELKQRLAIDCTGIPQNGTWSYLEKGLTRHDPKNWTKLIPFYTLPPEERPTQYTLEVMTGAVGDLPGLITDYGHTWIRLVKPTGEVISVGIYAPDVFIEKPTQPLMTVKAVIQCPDCYEFLPRRNHEKVSYPITEEKYDYMVNLIEAYQRLGIPYNALKQNCSDFSWAMTKAALDLTEEEAEEKLNFHVSLYKELPNPLQKVANLFWILTPTPLIKLITWVFHRIQTLFFTPLIIALGGLKAIRFSANGPSVGAVLPNLRGWCALRVILNHSRGVRPWQRQQPTWKNNARLVE